MLRKIIHKDVVEFKPIIFPEDFYLIQDTAEQKPLFPKGEEPKGLKVINKSLMTTDEFGHFTSGDYSIKGFEHVFAIERKQVSDFLTYIGKGRDSTVHKMERFKDMVLTRGGWAGLVIECNEKDLFLGSSFSRMTHEHIRAALVSFDVRSHVHIYYSNSRLDIARWVLDRSVKFYNIKIESKE